MIRTGCQNNLGSGLFWKVIRVVMIVYFTKKIWGGVPFKNQVAYKNLQF